MASKNGKPPKPVISTTKNSIPPKPNAPVQSFVFSFRFWKEIEYFEVGQCENSWFASLLERLTDLSQKSLDDFLKDSTEKDYYRYHEIKWDQKNIPIARADLEWLPQAYRDNDDEYPIFQFMLTKGKGRIAGFLDEAQVFNIVLLDPLHNLQPSKDFNYQVNPTLPSRTELQELKCKIVAIQKDSRALCNYADDCVLHYSVSNFFDEPAPQFGHIVLSAEYSERLNKILKQSNEYNSIDCVIEKGLDLVEASLTSSQEPDKDSALF